MSNDPPYPAGTLAKGWRFELDLERVRQSDTWALAAADARPWLFMLWCESWLQAPCGSLPADDAILCARVGMPTKTLSKHRAVLLRGWWLASDGRLYHPVVTELVVGMLKRKDADRQRKADYRARMDAERAGSPPLSHGTDTGQTRDSDRKDATGTVTSTYTGNEYSGPEGPAYSAPEPTAAGAICKALKAAGIAKVAPGHLRLTKLLEAGATEAEFLAHVPKAMDKGNDAFTYLLAIVEGERKRAAANEGTLHVGRLPNKQEALEASNRAVGAEWLRQQESADASR